MFRGKFEHAIDDKGRLSIPAKFRDVLREDSTLVLTSFGNYITAFPKKVWAAFEDRIRTNPTLKRERHDSIRHIFSLAEDVEIDRQGRILIPQGLRQGAGLAREVVIIGVMDEFEIWDKARWTSKQSTAPPPEELSANLGELGV
jgi:MraZ protein